MRVAFSGAEDERRRAAEEPSTRREEFSRPGQGRPADPPGASGSARLRESRLLSGVRLPEAPPLTLPTGGGAVRGIGEKVTVNAVNGTAGVSVPLGLTPCRGEAAPSLALGYDSGRGNGVFGLGWSLGVASIARRTDKVLPRYRDDGPDSDVFVLSGGEDLVPRLAGDALDERDAQEAGQTYRVRRYQPRVEGGYARIERWTRSDGDRHWRVTSRDNVLMVFGSTPDARIADPQDPLRVFEWLIESTQDDRGNVTSYTYRPEDTVGVDPAAPHEAHRIGQAQAGRLLSSVRYGNARPGIADGFFVELVLDYGDHDPADPQPQPDRPWPVRPDPYSSYRPGFEVRLWRRCRRLLLFHHVDGAPALVHRTVLGYDDSPTGSTLTSVSRAGRRGVAQLPMVNFGYSRAVLDPAVRELDEASAENLPVGLSGAYTFVDLDAEGLAGILTDVDGGWYYKRNLGGGHFAAAAAVAPLPVPAKLGGRAQLLDLDGDGRRSLVSLRQALPGFADRTDDDSWQRFAPFPALPRIDVDDPALRFVDLDGDGRAEILAPDDGGLVWYQSAGRAGFGAYQRIALPADEERGPALLMADGKQSLHLADMSGDGLADLVRVRAAEVCYWPSLGYGRFGAKVTMSLAPVLAAPDEFDPARVRLADVDGSGTADVVYLGAGGVRVLLNACGNGLVAGPAIPDLPHLSRLDEVSVVDLLGTGTSCLVWSTPLPDSGRGLRYLDLTSGKPYLLTTVDNGLGGRTDLSYQPSTAYYRADMSAGQRWLTRLPFVVQCLARQEISDATSDTGLVSTFSYHHGYYDRSEREFRGFARVDRTDAEHFGTAAGAGHLTDAELDTPPVLTRQWFHTGLDPARGDLSALVEAERYRGDPDALALPPPVLPEHADPAAEREAHRALRGRSLRVEVYGLDDPSGALGNPYQVSDHQTVVRLRQAARPDLGAVHAIFDVHDGQTLEHHYERDPVDPRVQHTLTLQVDEFGSELASARVAYPRRGATATALPTVASLPTAAEAAGGAPLPEQARAWIEGTRRVVAHQSDPIGTYRLGTLIEASTYELSGVDISADRLADADGLLAVLDTGRDLPYASRAAAGDLGRRAVEHVRVLYWSDDLSQVAHLGAPGSRALPAETLRRALDASVLAALPAEVTPAVLTAGGYVSRAQRADQFDATDDPDWWWQPSATVGYDPALFYQPVSIVDPFGGGTTVGYDPLALAATSRTDPVGNPLTAELDYLTLSPRRIVDANGDPVEARFDDLGRPVGTALLAAGDSWLGFAPDLDPAQLDAFLADPLAHAAALLGAASSRVVHVTDRIPALICSLTRERHADAGAPIQLTFSYTSGLGETLMRKARAAPGPAPWRDAGGVLRLTPPRQADPRWIGSARVVRNNKALPVKEYQPFFSDSHLFETEAELVEAGYATTQHFDPLGRLIRTDAPDGTYTTSSPGAWTQRHADANDTVLDSRWLVDQRAGTDPLVQRSVEITLPHAGTETVVCLDPLGRPVWTVTDPGAGPSGLLRDIVSLDVEGNIVAVTDARGVVVLRSTHDLLGREISTDSVDAGLRRSLTDAADAPLLEWTARGFAVRNAYDPAHRPTERWVTDPGATTPRLVERTVYGEAVPAAAAARLRGRAYQRFDGAGVATVDSYDAHGDATVARYSPLRAGELDPDWSTTPAPNTPEYVSRSSHDALRRPVRRDLPGGHTVLNGYAVTGLLDSVDVTAPDGSTTRYVASIEYDANGQRTSVGYGNGVRREYSYDPRSLRLSTVVATGPGGQLQDLRYFYDPVGNVTAVQDGVIRPVFWAGSVAVADRTFTYDPLYRLVQATGREHAGQAGAGGQDASAGLRPQYDHSDAPRRLAHFADANAIRPYTETYRYDEVGNILLWTHDAPRGGRWQREHDQTPGTNRLRTVSLPGDTGAASGLPDRFGYDARGNLIRAPHLTALAWDYAERLATVTLAPGREQRCGYGSADRRAYRAISQDGATVSERFYLGDVELLREYAQTGELVREGWSLQVHDGAQRIATVETSTVERGAAPAALNRPAPRFQLDDHLGSSCVELDEAGAVITYEEYYPFGSTSYQAGRSAAEVSLKRYRFTGRERDEETGFGYHAARYYIPWLGRWSSPDPAGLVDGPNRYQYARGNPVRLADPSGLDPDDTTAAPAPNQPPAADPRALFQLRFGQGERPQVSVLGQQLVPPAAVLRPRTSFFISPPPPPPPPRTFFNRGGGLVLGSAFTLGLGLLAVFTGGPLVVFAGVLAISGSIGTGTVGAIQLTLSYSGQTTVYQDLEIGRAASIASSLATPEGLLTFPLAAGLTGDLNTAQVLTGQLGLVTGALSLRPPTISTNTSLFLSLGGGRKYTYNALFQVRLPDEALALGRRAHNRIANQELLAALRTDASLGRALGKDAAARIGARLDSSPFGWVWHHAQPSMVGGQNGVLHLVPWYQHVAREFQYALHGGRVGGYDALHPARQERLRLRSRVLDE